MSRPSGSRERPPRSVDAKTREVFLAELAAGWSVTKAALAAGLHRQRVYELRNSDEDFRVAWDDAFEQGTDVLEDELRRRATEGFTETTFDGDGKLIRTVQRMASNELLATLKARRPQKYRDNAPISVSTTVGVAPVLTPPAPTPNLEIIAILRAAVHAGNHHAVVAGLMVAAQRRGFLDAGFADEISALVAQAEAEHARGELPPPHNASATAATIIAHSAEEGS